MMRSISEEYIRGGADVSAPSLVQTRLGPVEAAIYGNGTPVIALHGGVGGYDQSMLLAQAAIDAPGVQILALSRPGYLGTSLDRRSSPEQQADLYAVLLDALEIERAAVIAVSAGGLSALQFALRHPSRCTALVTVSACTGHLQTPPEVLRRFAVMKVISRIPFALTLMRRRVLRDVETAASRSIPDPATRARTLRHPQAGPLFKAFLAGVLDRLPDRLNGTENDITQCGMANAYPLDRISVPTLAIHGTSDRIAPVSHGQALANSVPGAEYLGIEGGEHVCLFTHLDIIRARVREFFAAHALS
jgi:pimeloyl-ACP methyl ester carboxylesterase